MHLIDVLTLLTGLSLIGLKVSLGLSSTLDELSYVLRRPALLWRAFIAIDVIPPAGAVALALLFPLEPPVRAGIVLMGLTPVQPLVPGKALGIDGRHEYSRGIYIATSLLAIVVMPVGFALAANAFNRNDGIGLGVIATKILKGVLLPLAVGLAGRRLWPGIAARLAPWLKKLGLALLAAAFLALALIHSPDMLILIGNGTLLAMLLVNAIALAGGHLLGGPNRQDRAILAMASGARHPGLALMIAAGTSFFDDRIAAGVLLYMLTGLAVGALYKVWWVRVPTPA